MPETALDLRGQMNGRLCLIHEGREADLPYLARLREELTVVPVRLEDIAVIDDFLEMACLVDLDLVDRGTIDRIRKALPRRGSLPRLFAVDHGDRLLHVQAGALGATACVSRPVVASEVLEHVLPAIRREDLASDLGRGVVPSDAPGGASILAADSALGDLFDACLTGGTVDHERLKVAGTQVSGTIRDIGLDPWMDTVRRHHGGTYQHCLLVTGIAVGFGTVLQMNNRDVERLAMAGLMHDVGKAQVPVQLLDKPGRLEEDEFAVMKKHPEYGFDFLRRTDPGMDRAVADAVHHHHEMLDGSGYPHGLAGNRIPDLTRIMSVCDIYGALAEKRAYKPPLETGEILRILGDLADKGKLERALVRALEAVVTGDHGLVRSAAPKRATDGLKRSA